MPSHTFTSDLASGLWSPATGAVALSTAGVERLRISSTGNVGIGTTSPTHALTLASGDSTALYNTADQTTNYERLVTDVSSNVFRIYTNYNGTGIARSIQIGVAGNPGTGVGITRGIQINNTTPFVTMPFSTGQTGNFWDFSSTTAVASSGTIQAFVVNPVINETGTAGYTALLVNPTETTTGSGVRNLLDVQVGGASKLLVQGSGNVGIGTTSPSHTLDVNGSINSSGNISMNTFWFNAGNSYSGLTNGAIALALGAPNGSISQYAITAFSGFQVIPGGYNGASTASPSFVVNSSGNVGIGTTAPGLRFEVDGPVSGAPATSGTSQTGIARFGYGGGADLDMGIIAGGGGAWLQSVNNANLATNYALLLNPNGGNVGIGTTSPTSKFEVTGGAIVADAQSSGSQCINFATGNMQVSSYSTSNTIKLGGLVDGGAYSLILTGYTGSQTITVNGFTDANCSVAITNGVDFGGSSSAITPTFVAGGNTQVVTFLYSASRGVLYGSAATNFYH